MSQPAKQFLKGEDVRVEVSPQSYRYGTYLCRNGPEYKEHCHRVLLHGNTIGLIYKDAQVTFVAPAPLPKAPVALTEAQVRKGRPVATGVLNYFPDAIYAVAEVSRRGNDQHNPGKPLHWAREKSTDQLDAAVRHIMDHMCGHRIDKDGNRTLAQAAWRILAECQLDIESEKVVK